MEIRRINFKVREYQIVNESWSNSYAWGHKSTLFRNGIELASTKVRYYNRTWECYQYQSSMYRVVEEYLDEIERKYINNYKREKEIERFKRGEIAKISDEDYEKYNLYLREEYRQDQTLIEVVEELGEKASGRFGKLEVVEIPDNSFYKIDEYDGLETLYYSDSKINIK